MILLLGGTAETATIAESLAARGFRVLVSTATDIPIDAGRHPNISRRRGRLQKDGMAALIRRRGILAVVDAAHPYAVGVHEAAGSAAGATGIPYLAYARPATPDPGDGLFWASGHPEAAALACAGGRPVLLTIGSKNLQPYVRESARTGVFLAARVLPHPDSVEACRRAGIPAGRVICGRGPFDIGENRRQIRRFGIGMLVTKESGEAGGVREKIDAARLENCGIVVVARPLRAPEGAFDDIGMLVDELSKRLLNRLDGAGNGEKGGQDHGTGASAR
jgi:precorrin-6A/cobalt-precorrin-6A reductase